MRAGELWTALRFASVGVVNTAIGLAAILALQGLAGWHPFAANAGGYMVGGIVSYLLNRRYTFNSLRMHRQAAPRFAAAMAACFGLNLLCLQLALHVLGWSAIVAQALAVGTYTLAFFGVCRLWVFAPGAEHKARPSDVAPPR